MSRGSRGAMALIAAACAAALMCAGWAGAGLKKQRAYDVGDDPIEVTFAKLPGDSRTDLIVSNRDDNDISILRGRRNGKLRSPLDVPAGQAPMGIAQGDFNRDGRIDLAVANQTDPVGGVTILLSAPGGGFVLPAQTFTAAQEASYIVAGRFTADQDLDLAVTGFENGEVTVLRGDGTGDFDPLPTISKPGAFPIGAGDFDRDGEMDLVVGGSDDEIDFYAGTGNGQFADGVPKAAGDNPNGLAVGRINSDRKLDVAVANYGGVGSVSVLLGKGDGTFRKRQINFTEQNSPSEIELIRFNGDRFTDLALADNGSNKLWVLRGKRGGRFRAPLKLAAGGDPYGMGSGRLHGDRLTDVAVANAEDDTVSLYLGR